MRSSAFQRALALVICIALLIKAVLPSGFMPDFAALANGTYKIAICSAEGVKDIWVDPSHPSDSNGSHDSSGSKPEKSDHTCPFAGLHTVALPVLALVQQPASLLAPILYPALIKYPSSHVIGTAWPRGPPASLNS